MKIEFNELEKRFLDVAKVVLPNEADLGLIKLMFKTIKLEYLQELKKDKNYNFKDKNYYMKAICELLEKNGFEKQNLQTDCLAYKQQMGDIYSSYVFNFEEFTCIHYVDCKEIFKIKAKNIEELYLQVKGIF